MIPALLLVAFALGEVAFRNEPRPRRLAWSLGGFGILAGALGLLALTTEPATRGVVTATVAVCSVAIILGVLLMRDRFAGASWLWVPVLAVAGGSLLWSAVNLVAGAFVVRYLRQHRAVFR